MTSIPWVEKYRPKKIDDVVHQEEVTRALKEMLTKNNLPHLLFYGPAGTGKTSTILAAAKELYGPDFIFTRVLELNASDERGINVIRSKVKDFAQLAVGKKPVDSKYPVPPFKLIILDEADSMTRDAQAALRRTMEVYSKVTRFCLICNYVSRIIEPVASRCAKFRFKPLDQNLMFDRLKLISSSEGLNVNDDTLKYICEVSGGDMRRGITTLQSTSSMFSEITKENIAEVSGLVPNNIIENFFKICIEDKDINVMINSVQNCIRNAYPATQILDQLHDVIIHSNLNNLQKAKICLQLGHTEKALKDGADESLQLRDLGAFIIRTTSSVKNEDLMVDI